MLHLYALDIIFIFYLFIYLQALSNLTGDPYRAHCSINRVPKFKYEQYLQDCGYSLSSVYETACSRDRFLTYNLRLLLISNNESQKSKI